MTIANPATPTNRFTKPFKRLVNFLNLRKNIKQSCWHTFGIAGLRLGDGTKAEVIGGTFRCGAASAPCGTPPYL